jgi:hypothetical protein
MAPCCRWVVQLQSDLSSVNQRVADVSMVQAVLEGPERERLQWTGAPATAAGTSQRESQSRTCSLILFA